MTTQQALATDFASSDFVNSDFDQLASHMRQCMQSRTRLSGLGLALDMFHAAASARIVTTGAVFAACALVLLSIA